MSRAWGDLRRRGPGPLVAVALSAIWPGLGHFGHRNGRALVLGSATLAAAVVGLGYVAARGARTLLVWSVTMPSLRVLMVASVVVLAFRAVVAADAYRTAARRYWLWRRAAPRRFGTVLMLILMSAVIAAPHVVVIRFVTAQMAVLSDVFDVTAPQTAIPTPVPTTTVPTILTPGSGGGTPGTSVPLQQAASVVPTTLQPPIWDGAERLTIALLGSDAGFDRRGVRTDTIIVLSIDVATGDAAAFSIPRNWRYVTFPEGTPAAQRWPDGYPEIVNEIYGVGLRFPDAFPDAKDAAGHAIKSALAQLTGLHIQYYVLLDVVGFVKVIDLFGGIDLHVSESINDRIKPIVADGPHIDIVVEPGDHHFDGLTTLGYVRSRTQSTDWHRMTRQRCVVEALIDQVPPLEVIYHYVAITGIMSDHINTDIPLNRLEELITLANKLDTRRIVTVNFIPPEFQPGDAPIAQVRQAVSQALQGSNNQANVVLADSCHRPQ